MMKTNLIFISIALILCWFSSCKKDNDPIDVIDNTSNLNTVFKVTPTINGEPFKANTWYQTVQGDSFNCSLFRFYLSDIKLINKQKEEPVTEIMLFDLQERDEYKQYIEIKGIKGQFTSLEFGAGVKPDLNNQDPSKFDIDAPLGSYSNMWWSWGTQYIFLKTEGTVTRNGVNKAWFIHSGLNQNYVSNVRLDKNFNVTGLNDTIEVKLSIDNWLTQPNDTIKFFVDGQTHTDDNPNLAARGMRNFSKSFY